MSVNRVKGTGNGSVAVLTEKAAKSATPTNVAIVIPKPEMARLAFRCVGDTPYMSNAWSATNREQMLAKQMGKPVPKKAPKDPWLCFVETLHWVSKRPKGRPTEDDVKKATFGIPASAFKTAAVDAIRFVDGLTMTQGKLLFFVLGELLPITGSVQMHEGMVRLESGVADIRFRGLFPTWEVPVTVEYPPNVITGDSIVNLFQIAGQRCGVGDGRPSAPNIKNGERGRFHVEVA